MNFFNTILDYIQQSPSHRLIASLILWIFWPGLEFIVGAVAESRLVPIWEHQAKMFFPGDLMLGIATVGLLHIHAHTREYTSWSYSWWWWLAIAVIVGFIAWKVRADDVGNYPFDVSKSPTKWVHDVVGYFIFPTILVGLFLPQVIRMIFQKFDTRFVGLWLAVGFCVAFYIGCTIYDQTHSRDYDDLWACHPGEWAPIWRK